MDIVVHATGEVTKQLEAVCGRGTGVSKEDESKTVDC